MRIFIFFVLLSCLSLYAQDFNINIVEYKGKVDLSSDGSIKNPQNEQIIQKGNEIFTGFHSQITLEVGKNSYITVNQLSHVVISDILIRKKEVITSVDLRQGYVVVLSKAIGDFKNKICVVFKNGEVELNETCAEIYYRKDNGANIKSFSNFLKISSKYNKSYFLFNNETCTILPEGVLLENDYFLKRFINIKPNYVESEQDVTAYYNFLFMPYSEDLHNNDFTDHYQP